VLPTWVGVVMAVSLAIIALATLVVAAVTVGALLRVRALIRVLQELAGPAIEDVREILATIRAEVEGVAATSRDVRARIARAVDAAQARLTELNAMITRVQGEIETGTRAVGAVLRGVRRSGLLLDWGRRLLKRGRGRR
jgi:uncharacterized protein YoxC